MENNEEIKTQLQQLINNLLVCEKQKRDCNKCKLLKKGCLVFIRNTIAVALQFILTELTVRDIEPEENFYT